MLNFVTFNFVNIKQTANASRMGNILKDCKIITDDDLELIKKEKHMKNKNEVMVKAVVKSLHRDHTRASYIAKIFHLSCIEARCTSISSTLGFVESK